MAAAQTDIELLIRVRGTVQGVGFRPFVHRLASRFGFSGWVCNDAGGVLVCVAGPSAQLSEFKRLLHDDAPVAARVVSVEIVPHSDTDAPAGDGFRIVQSEISLDEIETSVPPDLALCADCRRELDDSNNRRHRYPFINCTQCGPRYSIIENLPYDRARTTMRVFTLCPQCRREYEDPLDRRFHAEPNACATCGPALSLTDPAGREIAAQDDAIHQAATALLSGRIVAVKGLGGFHLMCDATSEDAVATMRQRKHREEKPLAVMFPSLSALLDVAPCSTDAAALLQSPGAPIVLVPRRSDSALASSIAPGNPWIGALLPYTPLHVLLINAVGRPLVATSANLAEEPLCTDNVEARARLAGIADLFLTHNRVIAHPVDDSVVRLTNQGHRIVLRRARGYAPSSFRLPTALPQPLLCVGAQMKNTVAVAMGDRVVLSPHIGDLEGPATQRAYEQAVTMLGALHRTGFAAVVCDKHPDYISTRYGERFGLPIIRVQHHLAHVLAVLLEHGETPEGVLGFAWDGTGFGEDGTIWGGEAISLNAGSATRFARMRPFRLIGGEAAVRDTRRMALAIADVAEPTRFEALAARLGFTAHATTTMRLMLDRGINSPACSSVGRLFDAVGALLALGERNSFEGQTPLAVEVAAMLAHDAEPLTFDIVSCTDRSAAFEIDWRPAFRHLLDAPREKAPTLAAAFHLGLAQAAVEIAKRAGSNTVVLSGGCFQNALLLDQTETRLAAAGFRVLTARDLPPNDGSISAGQAFGASLNLHTVLPPGITNPTHAPTPAVLGSK